MSLIGLLTTTEKQVHIGRLHMRRTQSAMGGSRRICLPTNSHLGQSGGKVTGHPMQENQSDWPRWPNMPWFWDLVAMSSQIPLTLPNLLTQPFNQIPQRNLRKKNLHAWLLEPIKYRLFSARLKPKRGGVWYYLSDRTHTFSVIDWLATKRRMSEGCLSHRELVMASSPSNSLVKHQGR